MVKYIHVVTLERVLHSGLLLVEEKLSFIVSMNRCCRKFFSMKTCASGWFIFFANTVLIYSVLIPNIIQVRSADSPVCLNFQKN